MEEQDINQATTSEVVYWAVYQAVHDFLSSPEGVDLLQEAVVRALSEELEAVESRLREEISRFYKGISPH